MQQQEKDTSYGLPKHQKPYFNLFAKEVFGKLEDLSEDEISVCVALTKDIGEIIERETNAKYFWDSKPARLRLQKEIQEALSDGILVFGANRFTTIKSSNFSTASVPGGIRYSIFLFSLPLFTDHFQM